MKKFNTLQELWSYCLFCPLCQDVVRDTTVMVGPTDVVEIDHYSVKKINEILQFRCLAKMATGDYVVTYYIDCVRNTFTVSISDPDKPSLTIKKASTPTFYFSLLSNCLVCNNTSANSVDIEIDLLSKKVTNFSVCMEGIYLLNQKNKYHLTLNHESEQLTLSKCFEDDDGAIVDDNKTISFPLTHFDFSKPKKVLNRIRTLLVFS